MPETGLEIAPNESWSSEGLTRTKKMVIRKMLTPAIYVEKPLVPPLRKTSLLSVTANDSDDEYANSTTRTSSTLVLTDRSIKRCTCISNPVTCQCHFSESIDKKLDSASSSSIESQITVKSRNLLLEFDSDMRLSLGSIKTDRTINLDVAEKEEKIQDWLKNKERELKHRKLEEERKKRELEKLKEQKVQERKESYLRWQETKKIKEDRIKREKERKEKERIKIEEEKQRKQEENEKRFKIWLKQKKQVEIEKKLQQKMEELKHVEEKQKRLKENEKAFHEWLKISKYRAKPIPLNKGLQKSKSSYKRKRDSEALSYQQEILSAQSYRRPL